MKFVIFGISAEPKGVERHSTPWRGLIEALRRRGHGVVFYERGEPESEGEDLVRYRDWDAVAVSAREQADGADAAAVSLFHTEFTNRTQGH